MAAVPRGSDGCDGGTHEGGDDRRCCLGERAAWVGADRPPGRRHCPLGAFRIVWRLRDPSSQEDPTPAPVAALAAARTTIGTTACIASTEATAAVSVATVTATFATTARIAAARSSSAPATLAAPTFTAAALAATVAVLAVASVTLIPAPRSTVLGSRHETVQTQLRRLLQGGCPVLRVAPGGRRKLLRRSGPGARLDVLVCCHHVPRRRLPAIALASAAFATTT